MWSMLLCKHLELLIIWVWRVVIYKITKDYDILFCTIILFYYLKTTSSAVNIWIKFNRYEIFFATIYLLKK